MTTTVTRRDLFKFGGLAALGVAGASTLAGCGQPKTVAEAAAEKGRADTGAAAGPAFLAPQEPITDFAETHEYDVVVVGAGGATLLAIMGGYALAKFRFPGRNAVFVVIIGAISVPGIALAVPQFLLFAKLGLTNTPWAMIIPSLISPFGLYLMWIFSEQAVPQVLLEADPGLSRPEHAPLLGRVRRLFAQHGDMFN